MMLLIWRVSERTDPSGPLGSRKIRLTHMGWAIVHLANSGARAPSPAEVETQVALTWAVAVPPMTSLALPPGRMPPPRLLRGAAEAPRRLADTLAR